VEIIICLPKVFLASRAEYYLQMETEDSETPIATQTRVPPEGYSEPDEDEETEESETDLIVTQTRAP
jgi:hypothetical protein